MEAKIKAPTNEIDKGQISLTQQSKGIKKRLKYLKTDLDYKPLPARFKGTGGLTGGKFTLLGVLNCAYLYQVSRNGQLYYHVFKRRLNPIYGNVSYPGLKAFGVWAWTFQDLKSAIVKYNQLNYSL